MAIKTRIEKLEQSANTGKLKDVVYCVCLPATDDAEYQRMQDDIIKRESAGQKVIVFEIVDPIAR